MTVQISGRQCILLLIISIFALKFQGLFAMLSGELGRDAWLFVLFVLIFDIGLLLLTIYVLKKFPNKTLYEFLSESIGKFFAKLVCICFAVYFIFKAVIPYKGINDLFGNVLFEYLPWSIFSIVLLLTLLFMASKGLKGLGRMAELFIWVILVGIIGCLVFSITMPQYERLLPILENGVSKFSTVAFKYNMWFGDYLLLFMMMGKIDIKIKFKNILFFYLIMGIMVVVLIAMFYALYENVAIYEYQGLTAITQFAFSGLDIGKIDKILVLFSFVSTIIATAVYIFCSSECLSKVFGTKSNKWYIILCLAILYVIDNFISGDITYLISFFKEILSYFGAVVHVGFTILFFIIAVIKKRPPKPIEEEVKNA